MCNPACLAYGQAHLNAETLRGRRVIEVGSRNVNGSLRSYVEQYEPASYLGVDIEAGPGVDEVCDAEDLVRRYGTEQFDVVICTEVLEHVRDWRLVISNLKRLLAADGVLLITTRSFGFKYHAFPYDFWRYEVEDMRAIFADLTIVDLDTDPGVPGVFLTARRPTSFVETDTSAISLYSMVTRGRIRELTSARFARFVSQRRAMQIGGRIFPDSVKARIKSLLSR